ncbi:GNAT family N-acetyltransferase [Vibrio nitrifigilis]|uniref:GNAT family N-acetyltransferase n=1 Tax=Vibrio nitrifigilis TaxID=2789781 RepID=A0ABS0GKE6_9VIBR|nr:GNAT family N-acetyltransferase [Vibrio nitrifigilis]MBF9002940.1 GNAT family N-acetyltransferase [Vibrio nitrifigilis]
MEVKSLERNAEYLSVLEVLLQLRSQYDVDSLSAQIEKQKLGGYQIVYVKDEHQVLAVAGYSLGEKLAWGKYIYIEDLVTNDRCRSDGVGKFLMEWFKAYASKIGCQQIHLDSAVHRFPAHKFYLREGFNIASHHFSIVGCESFELS